MTYTQIEELSNKLELYIENIEIGPEHDNLLNQQTKLYELLDNLDAKEIDKDSNQLLINLKNEELDKLIIDSFNELNEFKTNIDKATKLAKGIENIISKLKSIISSNSILMLVA
jgi:hypothetical protein